MFDSDAKVKKDLDTLVDALARMTAQEVCGVAQILGLPLTREDGKPIDAEEFLLAICTNFCTRPRKQRKNLLKVTSLTTEGRPLASRED